LCGHVEEILLLNTFFWCEDIAQQSCTMVRPVFPASRVHTHILSSHFGYTICGRHLNCGRWD